MDARQAMNYPRQFAKDIYDKLYEHMMFGRGSDSINAAKVLLDRSYGKPVQHIEMNQTSYTDFLMKIAHEQKALPETKRLTTLETINNTIKLVEEVKQNERYD